MLIRARLVLPLSRPPLEDGALLIADGRIVAVGRWPDLRSQSATLPVCDLGERMVLPGLINPHCHLDYTDLAGQLTPTPRFSEWIKALLALKAGWGYSEFARSWLNGAAMLLRTGTTTVLDIEAVPELLPEVWQASPLRVISCLELIALRNRVPALQRVEAAVAGLEALPGAQGRVGLSPHACYTTSSELLRHAARAARRRRWPLTTHVAESREEFDLFVHRRGPMFEWLGSQRDMTDCGQVSPVQLLAQAGVLGEGFLAVHVNYLAAGDAGLLARRHTSVVHCPRSHAFFQHEPFPLEQFLPLGVNVCVGTDSLASVARKRRAPLELNLFTELQTLAARAPGLAPRSLLEMVTTHAARALGRAGELGELRPGARADLIVLPGAGGSGDLFEAAVHHQGAVAASMIEGRWAIPPAGLS